MKKSLVLFSFCVTAMLFIAACGYHNPYVYSGPDRTIYMPNWKNRTNELQLSSDISQALRQWFQKSGSFTIVGEKEEADLILGGEVISIDSPSLSYAANNRTREVNLKLKVRYVLKDIQTDQILIEVPSDLRTEEYTITSDSTSSSDNEAEALETIVDDLAQDIYLRTLTQLRRQQL